MDDNLVIISTKEKPIILKVLAALFFTLAISLFVMFFYSFQYTSLEGLIGEIGYFSMYILIFVFGGISFSVKNTMFFDLRNKKFKSQLSIGSIKTGKWQDLPPLNYVSVFGVYSKHYFEINLWYNRNQYINIFTANNKDRAFELGFKIANELKVKLLDATEKNNYKYLNMDQLKEKYK